MPEKIIAFTQPLPSGTALALGTTKTSVAKFWVGVGALQKKGDTYMPYIFSPKQLEAKHFVKEKVMVQGLRDKNFQTIRVISDTK